MAEKEPEGYRTLFREGSWEFTEKKSRFIGYAAPALTEEDALHYLQGVRERHPQSSCICHGYISGYYGNVHRFFDGHEPQGGLPILDALKKRELCGAVAAVVRYFGGIHLGAGPLGRAFGRAAAEAIVKAEPCYLEKSEVCRMDFPYELSGRLEYYFEHSPYRLEGLEYRETVSARIAFRLSDRPKFLQDMAGLTAGKAEPVLLEQSYRRWDEDKISG